MSLTSYVIKNNHLAMFSKDESQSVIHLLHPNWIFYLNVSSALGLEFLKMFGSATETTHKLLLFLMLGYNTNFNDNKLKITKKSSSFVGEHCSIFFLF